uniref:AGC-kinase C-terminal domain-containing protein n=2 Tax=Macrostomum lignano TaxID=282301 RepID=A0A1I8JB59_9PLAT
MFMDEEDQSFDTKRMGFANPMLDLAGVESPSSVADFNGASRDGSSGTKKVK